MTYTDFPSRRGIAVLAFAVLLSGCATNPPEKFAATDVNNTVSDALARAADESRARGDLASAATLYRNAHAADPEKAPPLIALGQVLSAGGAPKDGAEAFRMALRIEPGSADALRGLGNAMVAIDQPELAIGHYEMAMAIAPKDPRIFNGLGVANDLLGRHDEAQDIYRTGLSHKADDVNLRTNLGLSLAFSGKYDASIDVLRKLVAAPQATAHHRQNLALALGLADRSHDAAKISRIDLDDRAVRANIAYYATLRALPDPILRVKAIHARHANR